MRKYAKKYNALIDLFFEIYRSSEKMSYFLFL